MEFQAREKFIDILTFLVCIIMWKFINQYHGHTLQFPFGAQILSPTSILGIMILKAYLKRDMIWNTLLSRMLISYLFWHVQWQNRVKLTSKDLQNVLIVKCQRVQSFQIKKVELFRNCNKIKWNYIKLFSQLHIWQWILST